MSILWVRQHWVGREGVAEGIGSSEVTRSLVIRTNNKFDTDTDILASGLVPVAFQSTLPENSFFLCRSVTVTQRTDDALFWDGEVTYSDAPLSEEERERNQQSNPLARPPRISWSAEQYQKATPKDIEGNAILNSAFDPFDPPPTIDDARWIVSVTTNVSAVPAFILTLNNTINSSAILVDGVTFAQHTAKVQGISIGEEQTENGVVYREFSYQLHFRKETWKLELLDAGFNELGDTGCGKKEILNPGDKSKPTTPQPLNGFGLFLECPDPSEAQYVEYDVYEEADLSILPGVN